MSATDHTLIDLLPDTRTLTLRVTAVVLGGMVATLLILALLRPEVGSGLRTVTGALGALFAVGTAALGVAWFVNRELRRGVVDRLRASTLIEQTLVGVTLVRDGTFVFVNDRFAEIFGYEPEGMTGGAIHVLDVIDPAERDVVRENLRRRIEGEVDDIRYRFSGRTKQGEAIRVEVYGRRVVWEGRPAVLSVHVDITEEERLRRHTRQSQRLQVLGELTGAVAHDFNNLLTAIVAPLDLCADALGPDHPAREELFEAKASAERAVTLTRQLLAFSRRRIYRPRVFEMAQLLAKTEPMLRRLLPAGVRLHIEAGTDLPPVEVDPAHFEQVLLNLVTNAAEALAGSGGIWIRLRAGDASSDGPADLILEVADDGRGMDETTRLRIFEPFFTTREQGTGLGLSTVHGIVTQEGGEVTVESTEGEGTTFRIRLPGTTAEPERVEEAREDREPRIQLEPGGRDRTVLVVDDEDAVRRVTTRVLERHGIRTRAAATGEAALRALRSGDVRFDLLLTDVGLPDINGVDLADRVRELVPGLAVLYMSGHSDESVLGRLARERSVGFVEKPFSVAQLLAAVGQALEAGEDAESRRGA